MRRKVALVGSQAVRVDDPGEGSWSHFNFKDHVTDMRQDDPRALPGRGEFRASVGFGHGRPRVKGICPSSSGD